MYHKTFILLFVVWYYANTVNGSPISFESKLKCGDNCKATTEDWIRIQDGRKNQDQAGHFNTDLGESKSPTVLEPVALKRRKRQVDNASPDAAIPTEKTSSSDHVETVAQLSGVPEPPKNEIDFTNSAEYKKAQENLLSAAERVTDSKVSSDTDSSSDDNQLVNAEILPDGNNQISTGTQDLLESMQPPPDSSDAIISIDNPKHFSGGDTDSGDTSKTTSLNESAKAESVVTASTPVRQDNDIESDTLLTALDSLKAAATSEESTELESKAVDLTVVIATDDGNIKYDSSWNTLEEPKSSDKSLVKSDSHVKTDAMIPKEVSKSSEFPVEAIKVNTSETGNSGGISEKTTENKSSAADKEQVARDDGNKSTLSSLVNISTGYNSVTVNKPNDSVVKASTDEKSAIVFPSKQYATRKLDSAAEPKALDLLMKENVSDPVNTRKPTSSIATFPSRTHKDTSYNVEKQGATENNEKLSTPQTPIVAPISDNKADTRTKEIPKNGKESTSDDGIYFENENDFDEQMIEKHSFNDLIESPCNDYDNVISHDHRDISIDYSPFEDPVEEPCSDDCDSTEYSTNYVNGASNNYDQPADNVEYGEPTYDTSRHFFDEWDSENDFNDLFDADMEVGRNQNKDLQTSRFEHFHHAEDEFDDDDDEDFW